MRPWLQENTRLTPGKCTSRCENGCETLKHCKSCLFPVTHTKIGACLIYEWGSEKDDKTVVTVDLVPLLPIKANNMLEIFNLVTKSLIKLKPPNWMTFMRKALKQDRIFPEEFNQQYSTENKSGIITVAMKLLHCGKENNFIIRPGQILDVETFKRRPKLKKVYTYIKCLKTMLKADVSSYEIKKVVLSKEVHSLKLNGPAMKNVLEILRLPKLKSFFEDKIDFDSWEQNVYDLEQSDKNPSWAVIPIIKESSLRSKLHRSKLIPFAWNWMWDWQVMAFNYWLNGCTPIPDTLYWVAAIINGGGGESENPPE